MQSLDCSLLKFCHLWEHLLTSPAGVSTGWSRNKSRQLTTRKAAKSKGSKKGKTDILFPQASLPQVHLQTLLFLLSLGSWASQSSPNSNHANRFKSPFIFSQSFDRPTLLTQFILPHKDVSPTHISTQAHEWSHGEDWAQVSKSGGVQSRNKNQVLCLSKTTELSLVGAI